MEIGTNYGVAMMGLVFGRLRTILNYFGLLTQFQGKTEKEYTALLRGPEERRWMECALEMPLATTRKLANGVPAIAPKGDCGIPISGDLDKHMLGWSRFTLSYPVLPQHKGLHFVTSQGPFQLNIARIL